MDLVHLDPERAGQARQPALGGQRREATGELHGAERRRRRPVEPAALEGLAQDARVKARVVRDQDPALEQLPHVLEDLQGRRSGVDHRLRDAGEALDPAHQGPFRPHQRVECVVKLPAAHEHRAHLGQLAEVAGEPVGLGVDRKEFGAHDWLVEQIHERPMQLLASDGLPAGDQGPCPTPRPAPAKPMPGTRLTLAAHG